MAPKTRVEQRRETLLHRIGGLFAGAMLLAQTGVVWAAAYQPSDSNQPPSAQYIAEYQPPSESTPVSGTNPNTSSSRGVCDDTVGDRLLLTLAPQAPGGQSLSQQLTFVQHLSGEQAYLIEVNSYQDASVRIGQLLDLQAMRSSPELLTASLAQEHPGLTPEGESTWEIVVPCNPNNPSSMAIAQAPIDIGSPPTNVATPLANASIPSQRVIIYAHTDYPK